MLKARRQTAAHTAQTTVRIASRAPLLPARPSFAHIRCSMGQRGPYISLFITRSLHPHSSSARPPPILHHSPHRHSRLVIYALPSCSFCASGIASDRHHAADRTATTASTSSATTHHTQPLPYRYSHTQRTRHRLTHPQLLGYQHAHTSTHSPHLLTNTLTHFSAPTHTSKGAHTNTNTNKYQHTHTHLFIQRHYTRPQQHTRQPQ